MSKIVSKAQFRWLQLHLHTMRRAGVHYDRKRRLTRAQGEYLLQSTDYEALPERAATRTQP
jgi:hypothetical protein